MDKPIQWGKMLGFGSGLYALVMLSQWGLGQIGNKFSRDAKIDSAYVWSHAALDSTRRNYWRHYRDSMRLEKLEHKH